MLLCLEFGRGSEVRKMNERKTSYCSFRILHPKVPRHHTTLLLFLWCEQAKIQERRKRRKKEKEKFPNWEKGIRLYAFSNVRFRRWRQIRTFHYIIGWRRGLSKGKIGGSISEYSRGKFARI